MATKLSFVELILLGLELCGTYTLRADGQFGRDSCPIATTKRQLLSFAERATGMRGAATALRALNWVVDGSNSPMESALMLFLCLPIRMGGYAFPLPSMNPENELGKKASRMVGQPSMRCDLHWIKQHVVVEYDSSEEHLNPQQAATDALRANTLGYKDITVISVTPNMIADHVKFDGVAQQLAKSLDVYMNQRKLLYSKARRELREQLFPWIKRPYQRLR